MRPKVGSVTIKVYDYTAGDYADATVGGVVYGSLAVHREWLGMGWVISHIPTGYNLRAATGAFKFKKDAIEVMTRISDLADWPNWKVKTDENKRRKTRDAIREIAKDYRHA